MLPKTTALQKIGPSGHFWQIASLANGQLFRDSWVLAPTLSGSRLACLHSGHRHYFDKLLCASRLHVRWQHGATSGSIQGSSFKQFINRASSYCS